MGCVEAYKNYTVGDSLGWFDNLKEPKVDYQKWASGKHFSLGDFLIFKTDNNHTVVQTYNVTTYKSCDYNDADEHDTVDWSTGQPAFDNSPTVVSVPLLKEGPNYFFSGNYDGEQCEHGQHFMINVTHGKGLPQSLLPPDQQAPAPNAADYANSVPDTVVSSNFDNPKDVPSDSDGDGNGHVKATSDAGFNVGLRLTFELIFVCLFVVIGF